MRLRSFKLRFQDEHVRIVPRTDAAGCAFAGPGVDLRGEAAREVLALGEAVAAALRELEPGIEVRSIAVDLERPRVTATLQPTTPAADPRPRAVRLEGPAAERVVARTGPLVERLVTEALAALARRAARDPAGQDG